jgi:hypothetical protein
MPYIYPSTIYDKPRNLLAVLGTFWADVYERKDQVSSLVRGKAVVEMQTMLDVLELIASLSRYTVPIFHKDNWYQLRLLASERNTALTSLARFDGTYNYDAGLSFDVPPETQYYAFPLPTNLEEVPCILNRFIEPTLTWTNTIDYQVDLQARALVFYKDPFADPRVLLRPVYEAGAVVDQEAIIWVFRGSFDWNLIYQQFAYVLGLRLRSSTGYRDLMNTLFDAIVGGTAHRQVQLAFSAMTGIPLVREAEETVKEIALDKSARLIITDRNVYKFVPEATPIVAVGDVVQAGDSLTDALQFFEFNRGQVSDTLRGLAMGEGFLASCYYGDLIFENKEVPLEVITDDPSGFTKLKFALGGFPADVERFFADLHEAGVAAATQPIADCEDCETIIHPGQPCETDDVVLRRGTLAHLLDTRPVRQGEPTAAALPAYINPLKFLVENVLRNNAALIRIRTGQLGPQGVGLQNARLLQKIVPPHTALIVLLELTPATDSVTTNRIAETISTFTAVNPVSDTINAARIREGSPVVRMVSGTCQ